MITNSVLILEIAAVMTALLCVIFAVLEKRSSWILAIVSSGLYIPIFWSAELVWDSVLQVFFIGTAIYGFIEWGRSRDELPISRRPFSFHAQMLLVCGTLASSLVLITKPSNLFVGILDASMLTFSIGTCLLISRKIYDGWIYWLVIDSVASLLFFYKGLWGTSALYMVYVGLVIAALMRWKVDLVRSQTKSGSVQIGVPASDMPF